MGACTNVWTNREGESFPCGRCGECRKTRISGWSFRLMQESKKYFSNYFVTLTYDQEHVPRSSNGRLTLKKTDCQLFFKRLRKYHEKGTKIKYYIAGEYGTETERPHYHAIILGASEALIRRAWRMGEVHFGRVEGPSVGYTLKYQSKPSVIPKYEGDDRTKEFALMSKGMGMNYLTDAMIKWHLADLNNRMYIPMNDGMKISMPRYFKLKIYKDDERKQISCHRNNSLQNERDRKTFDQLLADDKKDELIRIEKRRKWERKPDPRRTQL